MVATNSLISFTQKRSSILDLPLKFLIFSLSFKSFTFHLKSIKSLFESPQGSLLNSFQNSLENSFPKIQNPYLSLSLHGLNVLPTLPLAQANPPFLLLSSTRTSASSSLPTSPQASFLLHMRGLGLGPPIPPFLLADGPPSLSLLSPSARKPPPVFHHAAQLPKVVDFHYCDSLLLIHF